MAGEENGSVTGVRPWLGLAVLSFGVSMIVIDGTIVSVATPTIITDLGLDLSGAQWLTAIYALVFAALLITVGRLGDRFGRRRLFIIGLVVFVGASGLAGQAGSGAELFAARFLQGVGASMILPSSLSTVNAVFTGRSRGYAFAVWGSVIAGMAGVGPVLGGWLTTDYSWRWAFYINVPIGALVVIAAFVFVDETKDPQAAGWDPLGMLTSMLGAGLLVFGLIEGQSLGWWTPISTFTIGGFTWPDIAVSVVPVSFAISAVSIGLFVMIEHRRSAAGRSVLFDLSLFRRRSFGFGNIAAFLVSLGEFGVIFILPLYLQGAMGYTALGTGFLILALAGGAFLAGGASAELSRRFGAKRVVVLGMSIEITGILLLAVVVSPTAASGFLALALAVYGFGLGLDSAQLTSVILEDVPASESGQASGMQSTARQMGSAMGIAILGTMLAIFLASSLSGDLADLDLPDQQESQIQSSIIDTGGAALVGMRTDPSMDSVVTTASAAYATATKQVLVLAAAFYACGLLVSLRLPNKPGSTEDTLPVDRRRSSSVDDPIHEAGTNVVAPALDDQSGPQ